MILSIFFNLIYDYFRLCMRKIRNDSKEGDYCLSALFPLSRQAALAVECKKSHLHFGRSKRRITRTNGSGIAVVDALGIPDYHSSELS